MLSAMVRHDDAMSFATKIDRWLIVVLLGGFVAMLMGAYTGVTRAHSQAEALFALLTPLVPVLIVALLAWPTRYELHEQQRRALTVLRAAARWARQVRVAIATDGWDLEQHDELEHLADDLLAKLETDRTALTEEHRG